MANDFKFWCPVEIEKATDLVTGDEIMRLGGIASTAAKDSDGEFLDPKGFDITPLMTTGTVNWHHQAKGAPATIIGEPSKGEIRPEGLYLETDLYPSSAIARDVWNLAQTLATDSKTRKLGYSIEGKVVKRKSNDKKSPDYKIIEKAIITGVAVTHQPKNSQTFADIIKGGADNDVEEEEEEPTETNETEKKSLDCNSGAPLVKESVDKKIKNQTFSKSEVMERLFADIPAINIAKAEKIYSLITKIAIMGNRKQVSDADIQKAYEILELDLEPAKGSEEVVEEVVKAEGSEKEQESVAAEGSVADKKEDEKEDEDDEKEVKKALEISNFADRIEKSIQESSLQTRRFVTAAAVLVKECNQKLEAAAVREAELLEIIKAQDNQFQSLSNKIDEFGDGAPAPKSITHSAKPVERTFQKAEEDEIEKANENVVSMSKQHKLVSEILDQATFQKGYDEQFSAACVHFETSKNLPAEIISRVKQEFGIQIVK